LIYAHENGCPWNEDVCRYACTNDNLEILKYARENGCPWIIEECLELGNNKTNEWIKANMM